MDIVTSKQFIRSPATLTLGTVAATEIQEVMFFRMQVAPADLGAVAGTISASEIVSASASWPGMTGSFCALAMMPQGIGQPTSPGFAYPLVPQAVVCRTDRVDLYLYNATTAVMDTSISTPFDFFIYAVR